MRGRVADSSVLQYQILRIQWRSLLCIMGLGLDCKLGIVEIKFDSFNQVQQYLKEQEGMKLSDAVESLEQKPLDPQAALEKILKLDRKHMNFEFSDPPRNVQFRVQNPSPLHDAPASEHLLRQFWRHAQSFYFRRLQQAEIERLQYFSLLLNQQLPYELPFQPSQDFWRSLELVFSPEYLKERASSVQNDLDARNWLCTLNLYNKLLQNDQGKSNLKLQKQYKRLLSARAHLQSVGSGRRFPEALRAESLELKKLLPSPNQQDGEVGLEIADFEYELQSNHHKTLRLFETLLERVATEQRLNRCVYCFGNEEIEMQPQLQCSYEEAIQERLREADLQLRYFKYELDELEKKQIAQSISKVIKVEKSRGQAKFVVTFEEAMNIKQKSIPQQELLRMNKAREYSLFKFYNTSMKTPYSYICQNYLGFGESFRTRNTVSRLKAKNMIEQMKKVTSEAPQVLQEYQKFDVCHHCKYLYPEAFLTKCEYSSERIGVPTIPVPYCDPYLTQISKTQTTKTHRYSIRKRNCLENYTKTNGQYSCNRKFCKYCLKQSYDGCLDKNGLCPFCQGACFCTRCTRQEMIVRMKSIYVFLGGQVDSLKTNYFPELQDYYSEDDEEEVKQVRKKGRPKKGARPIVSAFNTNPQHINTVRTQLEPLRLLSDMMIKRQKLKQRLLESEQEFFLEKVRILSKEFDIASKNGRARHSSSDSESAIKPDKKDKKTKLK